MQLEFWHPCYYSYAVTVLLESLTVLLENFNVSSGIVQIAADPGLKQSIKQSLGKNFVN